MRQVDLFTCKKPCKNCPYRKDAPLKLWHVSEYEKLKEKETDTIGAIYKCHKNNGNICVGWLLKQKEQNYPSIALRLIFIKTKITAEILDLFKSPTPLYKNVSDMIKANYPTKK